MPETVHPVPAADLLVHGTFTLRRAFDRLARPVRPLELPPWRPQAPEVPDGEQRPAAEVR